MNSQLYNEAAMEALRQIPPVNDVLRSPELAHFRDLLGQPFATAIIDSVFSDVRRELSESKNGTSRSELTVKIATEIARRLGDTMRLSLRRVINASGVVLHTNLGRAPLPEAAMEHLRQVSVSYSNLEFDKLVAEFTASTVTFPNVPPNAKDPFTPPSRRLK